VADAQSAAGGRDHTYRTIAILVSLGLTAIWVLIAVLR
jgi:hypothetical protein